MDEWPEIQQVKSAIESLIFTSNKPLMLDEFKKVFADVSIADIRRVIAELESEYAQRNSGIRVVEIAGGFQMVTAPENAAAIKNFYKIKNTEKLTGPSLETLAIVAYKQPVTRVDIEAIRGVSVDGVVKSLLEKNLIRIVGRKEVIGRPFVYGTTRMFLDYFGLRSLAELPKIEEFAQQDILMDVKLASGDAEITPLTAEEEKSLSTQAPETADAAQEQAPATMEAENAPQENS